MLNMSEVVEEVMINVLDGLLDDNEECEEEVAEGVKICGWDNKLTFAEELERYDSIMAEQQKVVVEMVVEKGRLREGRDDG